MLQAEGLTKKFAGRTAVNGVDLELREREILGLIGPNGAGKTTLVNMMTGAVRPTAGRVRFAGRDITGLKPHRIGRLGLSRTFQLVKPFPGMTVRENVSVGAMFGARPRGAGRAFERAEEVLEFVGLKDVMHRRADRLGVASRKRLEMAKALAMEPKVILFDEVMAGLNPREVDEAVELIAAVRDRGLAVLVIEHVMRAIRNLCDRLAVLSHGVKIAEGPVGEVLAEDRVIEAYLSRRRKPPPEGGE